MLKHKLTVIAALTLLGGSLALAQDAEQNDPSSQMRHHGRNLAEWHKKMCTERYARKVARLAYLEAKLDLTEQQRAAWDKWRQTRLNAATQERSACLENSSQPEGRPTAVEREARLEKRLSLKLQGLQASRPALEALYDVLTPDQRAVLDHPHHGWRHHGRWDEHHQPV